MFLKLLTMPIVPIWSCCAPCSGSATVDFDEFFEIFYQVRTPFSDAVFTLIGKSWWHDPDCCDCSRCGCGCIRTVMHSRCCDHHCTRCDIIDSRYRKHASACVTCCVLQRFCLSESNTWFENCQNILALTALWSHKYRFVIIFFWLCSVYELQPSRWLSWPTAAAFRRSLCFCIMYHLRFYRWSCKLGPENSRGRACKTR